MGSPMSDLTPQQDFATALAAFQAVLPSVGKDQTANTGTFSYSYADLTKITDKAFPLLSKHGFAFTALPDIKDGEFGLSCELMHIGGHSKTGFYPIPKGTAQQIGSAITYGRRYALCAVTGIAPGGEDDDGQTASQARSQPRRAAVQEVPDPRRDAWKRLTSAAVRLGWDQNDLTLNFAQDNHLAILKDADADALNGYAQILEDTAAATNAG